MPGKVETPPVEAPPVETPPETPPAGATIDERVAALEKEKTEWHGQREQLAGQMESLSSKQTELEAIVKSLSTPPSLPEAPPVEAPPIVAPETVPPPEEVKPPEVIKPLRRWLK